MVAEISIFRTVAMPHPLLSPSFSDSSEAFGQSLRRMIVRALANGWRKAWFWHSRTRQRRALSALDARLLNDISIDRRSDRREAAKGFWRD